jgi:phage baseplate assembly protein W
MATINKVVRRFTDLNLVFNPHPHTKDVLVRKNIDAIKTSVQNLILTKNYERPFHPEIGCQVSNLMFDNFGPATVSAIRRTILDTLTKFEPRANITDITILDTPEDNAVDIQVSFTINNVLDPITVTTTLNRVR